MISSQMLQKTNSKICLKVYCDNFDKIVKEDNYATDLQKSNCSDFTQFEIS